MGRTERVMVMDVQGNTEAEVDEQRQGRHEKEKGLSGEKTQYWVAWRRLVKTPVRLRKLHG